MATLTLHGPRRGQQLVAEVRGAVLEARLLRLGDDGLGALGAGAAQQRLQRPVHLLLHARVRVVEVDEQRLRRPLHHGAAQRAGRRRLVEGAQRAAGLEPHEVVAVVELLAQVVVHLVHRLLADGALERLQYAAEPRRRQAPARAVVVVERRLQQRHEPRRAGDERLRRRRAGAEQALEARQRHLAHHRRGAPGLPDDVRRDDVEHEGHN
mmetsp:Transcript_5094/g.14433  ORF Transcript_5094/g.14433 Transcript_5094/m.14433 type:complete len:210 (-) Transcript_5094:1252-1881(-)